MVVYIQSFSLFSGNNLCSKDLKWHLRSENKPLDDTR